MLHKMLVKKYAFRTKSRRKIVSNLLTSRSCLCTRMTIIIGTVDVCKH